MKYSRFPRAVEIQTVSTCNAKCVICPHPEVSKELPSGTMDMDVFCGIIDQIDPSWGCRIIPYLNSEPLLDSKIVSRLRYVCDWSERSEMELSTNMSALTLSKQVEMTGVRLTDLRLSLFGFTENTHKLIMPGLNWVVVKQNLDHLVANRAFRQFVQQISIVMIEHPLVTAEDVELAQRYCEDHSLAFNFWGFLDRAGNVNQYSNNVHRLVITGCEQHRSLERMHITFTGDVILCCQDWRWNNVIGNIKRQSLLDIWNCDAYQHYREIIYAGKGEQPEICSRCKLSVPSN